MTSTTNTKKKLIEVAIPLEAINAASAREKSIRHGHPSTLHMWWARRPLAACRAVLFAQLVDDPSSIPELTEERRKELVKDVKKKGEAAKVAIRNIRRDGNDAFKKLKGTEISEDGIKDLEDSLQKLTDKYIAEVDKAVEAKSKEVLTV